MKFNLNHLLIAGASALALSAGAAKADQVFNDDVIIDGSLCVGFDCVNGESFGFDTIRMKENNLRIHAQDTSTSASFPTSDWRLVFNETTNGGLNKFTVEDSTAGINPFTIESGSRSNALYVDDGGRVGFGTASPVATLHARTGNTPTLRLEQDGSSGFTAQTWDVAGNEANFFVRDATNGSTLPFRIQPSAPSNALYVSNDGDVGIGTSSPVGQSQMTISGNGSDRGVLWVQRSGGTGIVLEDTGATAETWSFGTDDNGTFNVALVGTGILFSIDSSGNATFTGTVTAAPGGVN